MGGLSETFDSGKQNEGLPNIKGTFGGNDQWSGNLVVNGAYSIGASYMTVNGGSGVSIYRSYFDASKGEAKTDGTLKTTAEVYGKSDHVTPENYTVKIWLRTA